MIPCLYWVPKKELKGKAMYFLKQCNPREQESS